MAKFIKLHLLKWKSNKEEVTDLFDIEFTLYSAGVILFNVDSILNVMESEYDVSNTGMNEEDNAKTCLINAKDKFSKVTVKNGKKSKKYLVAESFDSICDKLFKG